MDDPTKNTNQPNTQSNDPHQDVPPPPASDLPTAAPVDTPDLPTPSENLEPENQPARDEDVTHTFNSTVTPVSDTTIPATSSTFSEPEQPKPTGPKMKIIGAIAALVLLAVAIPAGIFLTSRNQNISEKAVGESCQYGEPCPGGGVQVCQGVKNEDGNCSYTGPCSGCQNPAICGNGDCEPGEGPDNCSDCGGSTQCPGGANPGDWKYDCTGNKAGCRGEAGEGVPSYCKSDGKWDTRQSECTNSCPVADNSNCEYRDDGLGTCAPGTFKLCSGKKDAQGVCKYDAGVSSCTSCEPPTTQSCSPNKNYESGLISGKPNPDPNCGAQGGTYCNDGGNFNVCCYADGNCYQGQQGGCTNLGNGAILLNATAQVSEYSCPGQTSSSGSCSQNQVNLGTKGPGTYMVGAGCGGRQIDAVGYCGSYKFGGACAYATPPVGAPSPTIQCLDIKIYTTAGVRIIDPVGTIKPGDTIRVAVSGNTNDPGGITKARFRFSSTAPWQETTTKNAAGEYYLDTTVAAGAFSVEAQVFNPILGWE